MKQIYKKKLTKNIFVSSAVPLLIWIVNNNFFFVPVFQTTAW